jgi:hypothetical protein
MKWMVHGKRLPGYYPRILCIVLTLLLATLSYYYQNIEMPEKLRQQEIMLRETMDLSSMEHDTVLMLRKGASLEKGSAIDEAALAKLEEVERKNNRMLDYLDGEPEVEIPGIMKIIMSGYNQHLILEHISAEVMKEPDKGDRVIRKENSGLLIYCLKTVIDCFDGVLER